MNREILFRGKRIDNDEWVYGLLVYMCEILYIVDSEIYNILDNDFENLAHAVKPETIGQYTGLTDKNGKKIFEGDIVTPVILTEDYYYEEVCIGRFNVDSYYDCYGGFTKSKSECGYNNYFFGNDCREVVGNVFDSPELLDMKYEG